MRKERTQQIFIIIDKLLPDLIGNVPNWPAVFGVVFPQILIALLFSWITACENWLSEWQTIVCCGGRSQIGAVKLLVSQMVWFYVSRITECIEFAWNSLLLPPHQVNILSSSQCLQVFQWPRFSSFFIVFFQPTLCLLSLCEFFFSSMTHPIFNETGQSFNTRALPIETLAEDCCFIWMVIFSRWKFEGTLKKHDKGAQVCLRKLTKRLLYALGYGITTKLQLN